MKKGLLSLLTLFAVYTADAQVAVDTTGTLGEGFNRWTIDVYAGQAKGTRS